GGGSRCLCRPPANVATRFDRSASRWRPGKMHNVVSCVEERDSDAVVVVVGLGSMHQRTRPRKAEMAVTLHDVAKLAGVSIKTVSNVVNNYERVRPESRARVQSAIDELDYKPNLSARSLRSGRSGVISLVVPELGLSYFAQLAEAVIERAEWHGLTVQVEQTGGDRDREIAMLSSARRQLADGLIFSPLGMGQEDADLLRVNYPMVILGERIFGGPVDHITMKNTEAAAAATRFLLESGRRRIAVIGAPE